MKPNYKQYWRNNRLFILLIIFLGQEKVILESCRICFRVDLVWAKIGDAMLLGQDLGVDDKVAGEVRVGRQDTVGCVGHDVRVVEQCCCFGDILVSN